MPHALTRLLLAIGWAILATTAHARDLLFQNVNVVPMDRERVLLGQSVLVQDGRIAAIGRRLRVPPDTDRINGRGKLWLSPGLADMHIHSDTADDLVAYLASGITTVVNMGDARASFVGRTTPAATRGDIPAPQVFNAFVLDGSPQYGHFTVVTPDEGRAAVRLARTNGYRMIKVYNNLQPAVFAAAAAEAKSQEMPLVGHGVTSVGLAAQIGQGQTLVAHAEEFFYTFFSPPGSHQTDVPPSVARIPEAIRLVLQKKVAVGADLITFATISRLIGHPEYLERCLAAPSADLVAPADRLSWRRTTYFGKTADLTAKLAFLRQLLKAMADANVELLSGTDAPSIPCVAPGLSLHDNLDELRSAGLTPYQALSTATRIPGNFAARTLSETRFGVIAPGARADLVLSQANPLQDLSTLRDPLGVMVGGQWHDSEDLGALLGGVKDAYGCARSCRTRPTSAH